MMHPQMAATGYNFNLDSFIQNPGTIFDSPSFAPVPKWCENDQAFMPEARIGSPYEEPTGKLEEAIMALLKLHLGSPSTPTPNLSMSDNAPPATQISIDSALSQEKQDSNGPLTLLGLLPPPGLGAKVDFETCPPQRLWTPEGACDQHKGKDGQGDSGIQQARDRAAAGWGLSGYATVMIQQIPFKYTQSDFMNEINLNGFKGTYDFLYLPVDARNPGNRGFGFVNFLSPSLAEDFYRTYNGQQLKKYEASTALGVIPADVQGFDQSAATFFASWHLRKKNRHSKPVFLRPVPAHLRQEGWPKGRPSARDGHAR